MDSNIHYDESPAKRRKLSPNGHDRPSLFAFPPQEEHDDVGVVVGEKPKNNGGPNISISANPRLAGQTVAPFLAKHIPKQYAPLGGLSISAKPSNADPNTKYCYRHRPDLKCRRQADEPSMDQLQHVSPGMMENMGEYADMLCRNSRICLSQTNKQSPMSGPCSRPHLANTET